MMQTTTKTTIIMAQEETLSAERLEAKRRAEIMLAYAEGKLIQTQKRDTAYPDSWSYCSHPNWAWDSYDYRVKPGPWRAKYRDLYWYVTSDTDLAQDTETHAVIDDTRYTLGNYFETPEEAERLAEELKQTMLKFRQA